MAGDGRRRVQGAHHVEQADPGWQLGVDRGVEVLYAVEAQQGRLGGMAIDHAEQFERPVYGVDGGHGSLIELDPTTNAWRTIEIPVLDLTENPAGTRFAQRFPVPSPFYGDEALWQATMDINLRAPFFLTQYALPALRESGGNVVMVSSVSGLMGHPKGVSVYCTSKGGLNNMTRVLALELADQVRVNAVAPGPIWTPLNPCGGQPPENMDDFGEDTPMGRPGEPNEVAPAFLFLACDDSSYMSGQVLHPNGGIVVNG